MRRAIIRLYLVAFWAMGVCGDAAWGGTLLARDGQTYAGKVELKAGNQLLVTPASGMARTVPLQDLARLSMTDEAALPAAPAAGQPPLPPPWQQAGLGSVKEPGSATEDKDVFTVRAAGWGIWGATDSFHFVYQPLVGDADAVARLGEPPNEENPFVAGLTIREGLNAAGPQASVMLFPEGGLRMSCRPVDGSAESVPPSGAKPYQWVRLVRAGDRFSGFCSSDGQAWILVGTVRAKMSTNVCVGLACAATLNQGALGTTFDHVRVTAQAMGPAEGLGLVDGSVIAGRAKSLAGPLLKYADPAGVERSLPAGALAYIFTRPLPPDVRDVVAQHKEGVAFVTGDELEGSVQGLSDGRLTVASLLLGRQTPALSKVVTAVLRPVKSSSGFAVATRDGSIYRCQTVTVGEGVVLGEGGLAGPVTVKAADLVELVRVTR
jgi:hypothetical protein